MEGWPAGETGKGAADTPCLCDIGSRLMSYSGLRMKSFEAAACFTEDA